MCYAALTNKESSTSFHLPNGPIIYIQVTKIDFAHFNTPLVKLKILILIRTS